MRPAISVGISVSRVGSAAQPKAMKQVAGRIKLDLAQFRELAAFAQFGSDLDKKTQAQLERGKRIVELFKQPVGHPVPMELQVLLLWAVQNGAFDPVAVNKLKVTQAQMAEYFLHRRADLLAAIRREKKLDDDLTAGLAAALKDFAATAG